MTKRTTAKSDRSGRVSGAARAASPELTSGTGFTFEDHVAGYYLSALFCETTAPGLLGRIVKGVRLQQGSLGDPMDDLIVEGEGIGGAGMRLSLQVKRTIVPSDANSNHDFRAVVRQAHATVVGPEFEAGVDRVGVVAGMISDRGKRDLETLCEWARDEPQVAAFLRKARTVGVMGGKRGLLAKVRTILGVDLREEELDAACHLLLSHFVVMRFDTLHEGSVLDAQAIANLEAHLQQADRGRASDLWHRLLSMARESGGRAASFDRKAVVAKLGGSYRLSGAPSMRAELTRVKVEAQQAVAAIRCDIAGLRLPRQRFLSETREALREHRFVQISGLPGTGKSAVLRLLVEEDLARGPVLLLKSDRLVGSTWSQYCSAVSWGQVPLEDLLVELEAVGSSTLFVDGLDRIPVNCRGVVKDVLNTLLASPLLGRWRVVATVRDNNIETLRTWLPVDLLRDGAPVVEVTELDDGEAEVLGRAQPALFPLLFGSEAVRSVVRRPFFAAVLSGRPRNLGAPASEVDLATAWWEAGGYGAEAESAGRRRAELVKLAQAGIDTLGQSVPVLELDPAAIVDLEADGVIRTVRVGQSVRFAHDIYFEWSFMQLLASRGDEWHRVIRDAGEPPMLGRAVELLSQAEFAEGERWKTTLELLESTRGLRSQWLRAWSVGPLGLPTFERRESLFDAAMLAEGARRVAKLAVWFQAEKTRANPKVLDAKVLPDLGVADRILLADSLAWPSDMGAWRRCCRWLLDRVARLPTSMWPDIVTVFEVWQNAASGIANDISARIVDLSMAWLLDIETRFYGRTFPKDRGGWDDLGHGERDELERRLRVIVLLSARAYPQRAVEHLLRLQKTEHPPQSAFEEIQAHSPILSEVCPGELVDFMLAVMLEPLPDEVQVSSTDLPLGVGVGSHDWDSLSIDDHHVFFPAAPTREPFASLFLKAPTEGRRLVRCLANHAVAAWRQLHRVDIPRRGSPIPLVLRFPWGDQTYWGTGREYLWSRAMWGPGVVESGLMALETWAYGQVECGRPVDQVLGEVLEGHESVSALGVAAAIAVDAQHCSATTLPLFTSQRLWHWDIQRCVFDSSRTDNLIGFWPKDRRHYEAVLEGNNRAGRRFDLRGLASMCVISGGSLGVKASDAISKFPDELPIDYVEQRGDPDVERELRRTAEIWAEFGKASNYRAEPVSDGSGMVITMDNPQARGPDVDATKSRHLEMEANYSLITWAHKSFEASGVAGGLTVRQAIGRARDLDSAELFAEAHGHVSAGRERQNAVAGVASVVLRFGQDLEAGDVDWASDVSLRAWRVQESPTEPYIRESALSHHPVLSAIRGLEAMVRRGLGERAIEALLTLAAHQYEQVAVEALGCLLRLWDLHPYAAWVALELSTSLSIVQRLPYGSSPDDRQRSRERQMSDAVRKALHKLKTTEPMLQRLPSMPPAWVRSQTRRRVRGRRGREVEIEWEHPSTDLDWSLLGKVLGRIPVAAAMADDSRRDLFLSWCDELARWTVERISPSWAREQGPLPFEVRSGELSMWRRSLYSFLAEVSLRLDPVEAARRYVEPAAAADDEAFCSLMGSYVSLLTSHAMDTADLPTTVLDLLGIVARRMMRHERWERSKWYEGGLPDVDLFQMIETIFFVGVDGASLAMRFANGDWTEVSSILPLIEPILAEQGRNPTVATAFLTLLERAFESFPVEAFARYLAVVIGDHGGTPAGWRGTALPARLSATIQRFSERVVPLPADLSRTLLRALDVLVDMGDRRAAAVQTSEVFRGIRLSV